MSLFLFSLFLIIAPQLICGSERIIGGIDAHEDKFNYQVSMRLHRKHHFCGGSILNKYWILTAAHCVYKQKPDNMTIVTGSKSLTKGGNFYQIEKLIPHQLYNEFTVTNDIALVKVKTPIVMGNHVQPIKLSRASPKTGAGVVLTGWGLTKYPYPQNSPAPVPDHLQMVELKVIDVVTCNAKLMRPIPILPKQQICTLTHIDQGACMGDSGGPLVEGSVQVGVVSFGEPCGKNRPDVFTDVSFYLNWINRESALTDQHCEQLCCCRCCC